MRSGVTQGLDCGEVWGACPAVKLVCWRAAARAANPQIIVYKDRRAPGWVTAGEQV